MGDQKQTDASRSAVPRVAIFEPHIFDVMSGNQRHIEAILTRFNHEVVEIQLLTPRQSQFGDALRARGVRVDVLAAPGMLEKFGGDIAKSGTWGKLRLLLDLSRYWLKVALWLRRNRIDLVECNSSRGVLMAGIPARLLGLRVVYYVKGHLETPLLDRVALKTANTILFQGKIIRDQSYPPMLAAMTGKVQILANGIDLAEANAARDDLAALQNLKTALGAGSDKLNFAIAGMVCEHKGQDRLIRAIASIQSQGIACRLFIIGDNILEEFRPYYESCRSMVNELGVQDVHFLGYRADAVAVMAVMDVIVLPSRGEGVPRTILEGMAVGKAVIVTDVGSVRDAVGPAEGLVIPANDAAALEGALLHMATDPQMRQRMGAAGFQRAHSQFDINRNIRELELAFRRTLELTD